jgi:hypothetical protein
MAGRGIMHRAHTADIRPTTIFIHNCAPQALDGSQAGRSALGNRTSHSVIARSPKGDVAIQKNVGRPTFPWIATLRSR